MIRDDWRLGPYGLDAAKGTTLTGCRLVLVVVHHIAAGDRLADVVPLVESDRRVQVVYTAPPTSVLSVGVEDYLRDLGGIRIPWGQAIRMTFDLALAAGDGMLQELHAPVMTLPHGVPPGVLMHRWAGRGPAAARLPAGIRLDAIVGGGRVIPAINAVAHEEHAAMLTALCPEAAPVMLVSGDPALDRIVASAGLRDFYRQVLGVGPNQRLVLVSSAWGPRSLLGRHPDLLARLASTLPPERYRIVAAIHPNVWSWHSHRQVRAWYKDCRQLGVRLLPAGAGWQAGLVAADRLVGDHGSVSCYGAALGVPTVLAAFPDDDVVPGSAAAVLGRMVPRLDLARELGAQIDRCVADGGAELSRCLTSKPGQSAEILRRAMYKLMDLPEPTTPAKVEPHAPPLPDRS